VRPASRFPLPAAALVAALSITGARHAGAEPPADQPPRDRYERKERLRGELFDQVRAMRVWMLTDELKLDEKQVAKLFPLLASFDEREQQLARERGDVARQLRTETDSPNARPAEIARLVDALLANRDKRNAFERERLTAIRRLLTPVQQGKLVLLWPRIEDMARRQIRSALRGDGEDFPPPPDGARWGGPGAGRP
jgi:Spy/CpxP family protein refolding chaperone